MSFVRLIRGHTSHVNVPKRERNEGMFSSVKYFCKVLDIETFNSPNRLPSLQFKALTVLSLMQ